MGSRTFYSLPATRCSLHSVRPMTPARASALLLIVVYLGFISLGLPDGTLGVAWPRMRDSLGLPIGLAGPLVLVITLLSGLSGFNSGRIVGRFGTGPVVLISCLATGGALVVISQAQGLFWLFLAGIPLGLGAGAVDAGLNGFVARHYSGRHMNWLHACWGIGATAGPLLMAYTLAGALGWRGGYAIIGFGQLGLALVFLLTLGLWRTVPMRHDADAPHVRNPPTTTANSTAGWLSAAIYALYVAVEGSVGLWAGSILVESRGFTPSDAGQCVTGYYGAITVGRILVGFVVEHWSNRRLVLGGAAVALVGTIVFAVATTTPLIVIGLVLIGLGCAPVYPGLMHEVPRRFAPDAVQTIIGRQSGGAYLGAAATPPLAGLLAQYSLESIAWGVIAGTAMLIATILWLDRLTPERN